MVEQLTAGTTTPTYLHCLPRSLLHAWIRHHADDQVAAAYTELPDIGTPDEEVTTIIDTSRYLAAREAAIALHRSQRSPFQGLPTTCAAHFWPPSIWSGSPRRGAVATPRPTCLDYPAEQAAASR